MAKYFQGKSMVVSEFLRVPEMKPVVVIPEGDWLRLVELATRYIPTCKCDGDCQDCREDAEIKEIVSRVEDANG